MKEIVGIKFFKSGKKRPLVEMKYINTIGIDGCACGEYNDGETEIIAHCHRSNGYYNPETKKCCNCKFAGVHYKGKLTTAKRIAKEIEEDYMCDVEIVKL